MAELNKSILFSNYSTDRLFDSILCCEDVVTIQTLLQEGVNIDARNSEGYTPLLLACSLKRKKIAELLIKSGANVDVNCNSDECSCTVLHFASRHDWLEIVRTLVKKVPDLNKKCLEFSETALHSASWEGYLEIVKCLVEEGADINITDKSGDTALHDASFMGYVDVGKCLVEKGANINIRNKCGETALHKAATKGYLEIVKYLVEEGADINITDKSGDTALHDASSMGHFDVVKCLVEKGANINIRNICGETALHEATREGYLEIVKYLVEKGFDINIGNNSGETALHYAASMNQEMNITQYLLQAGASWEILDEYGYSPLNYSTKKIEFFKLFIENGAYLKRFDYEEIVRSSTINVLQDVELCCQIIINKFNNHDLTEFYKLPASGILPHKEKIKIASGSKEAQSIKRTVEFKIHTNGHCNILEVHPMVLSVFCVKSVLEYYENKKLELQNTNRIPKLE